MRVNAQAYRDTDGQPLRINLVVSDERILIYAGSEQGLYTRQKLKVFRGQRQVGLIELTEVHTNYSVARVVSKTEDLSDMDLLGAPAPTEEKKAAPQKTPAAEKKAAAAEEKPPAKKSARSARSGSRAAADDKKTEEKAEKKSASRSSSRASSRSSSSRSSRSRGGSSAAQSDDGGDDKSSSSRSSRRRSSRSGSSSSAAADSDDDSSSSRGSSRRGRSRGSSSSDADDKSKETDDKKEEKAAKEKLPDIDPLKFKFPTSRGGTGLWTVQTAKILDKGHYSASYYRGWYSASVAEIRHNDESSFYNSGYDYDENAFSMTYGLGNRVEVYFSLIEREITSSKRSINMAPDVDTTSRTDYDGHVIGVKFNPRQQYVLKETTSKKWEFAMGASRIQMDDVDGNEFYGVVSMPLRKFDAHAGLFYYNLEGMKGKNIGTMAGFEFPLTPEIVLIGESRLFQSDYDWNAALRYIYHERGSLLLGVADTVDTQIKQLGLSYSY